VSEADMHGAGPTNATLERTRDEVLRAAHPLPPDEEALAAISPMMRVASSSRLSAHECSPARPGYRRYRIFRLRG
jgi:hypothetical protein